jgi:hypothetical protein
MMRFFDSEVLDADSNESKISVIDVCIVIVQIYGWRAGGSSYAVLPGLLAAIVGLLLWLASAEYVRRRAYDLFFVAHHLYIPFFLFWLYHVVWTYPVFIIPALLFFIDRFLRMLQSRRLVHVLCAKLHESGAVELVLPVDPGN